MGTITQITKQIGDIRRIPGMALQLMLAGILLPAVIYSYNLKNPTPAELLVAICVALFASVVFLWILDATSILEFKSQWIAKSVYGAAIASVLGTSVAVYKDSFASRKHPYEGRWEMVVNNTTSDLLVLDKAFSISYSERASIYWGFSEADLNSTDSSKAVWAEVISFSPNDGRIIIRLLLKNGREISIDQLIDRKRNGRFWETSSLDADKTYRIYLTRPR